MERITEHNIKIKTALWVKADDKLASMFPLACLT